MAEQTALTVIDHSARAHATLSASSAKRWLNCPGSVKAIEGLPNESSEYAERGTAAHELANEALLAQLPAAHFLGESFNKSAAHPEGFVADEAMCSAVQVYLDTCAHYMEVPWNYYVERKFSLEKLNPPVPMFGTSDFCAVHFGKRKLVVVDYKNGYGYVEAEGNDQLRYYALGALYSFDVMPKVKTVEIVIVQPNAQGDDVKREIFHVADLIEWSIDLMEKAELTQQSDAPLRAGDWCRSTFCPARGRCPAQAQRAVEIAQVDFDDMVEPLPEHTPKLPEVRLMTAADIGFILNRLSIVEDWAKSVRDAAIGLLERGIEVPGHKLVLKRATERWTDADAAPDEIIDVFGLDESAVYERKPVSPARVRAVLADQLHASRGCTKKVAEARAKALLSAFTEKVSSGTTLAPTSDARPAVIASVHMDFEALPAPSDEGSSP